MFKIDQVLAQQIVNTVKDVCRKNINFIDSSGIIIASTDEKRLGSYHEIGIRVIKTGKTIEVEADNPATGIQKGVNLPIYHKDTIAAVIGISGAPAEVRSYAHLAERITGLLIREQELNAYSKNQAEKIHYVIHSLIRQDIANPDYLNVCLADLKVDLQSRQRLIMIQRHSQASQSRDISVEQTVQQLFVSLGITMYTHHYPNGHLALIDDESFSKQASLFRDFAATHPDSVKLAVGKSYSIYHLSASYHSCCSTIKSLRTGKENYAVFDDLKLELLLSDVTSANQEVFIEKTTAALTAEEKQLLAVYFDSDLSLNRTCQKLFLHKNTLQYKLNQIYRKCGLNPRSFRDGTLLYLALRLE